MTHKQKIRQWFKTHKYLTDYQATYKLGVMNCRSRIADMPDIVRNAMINVKNADGGISRVAQYVMVKG